MTNYKVGTYSQKQLNHKKKCIRKNKHNKIYAGKHTKRELDKRIKIARTVLIMIVFIGISQWLSIPRTITIQGNGLAVETSECVPPQSAESADNSLSVDEVDYENIPYIEKDKGTVEERIKKAFPEDPNTAVAISKCESGLDKNVIGDKHTAYCSVGIMQIRTLPDRMAYYGLTIEKLKDIDKNLEIARLIKNRFGWQPWSCWTSGEYKKHL